MLNRIILILILTGSIGISRAQTDTTRFTKLNGTHLLSELRNQIDDLFNDQNLSDAFCGVYIKSLKNGEVIYKRNSDRLFVPASSVKLFTSAAALLLLGSNYKYRTYVYTDGKILNDTLVGNIIIRGSGDPTISLKYPLKKSHFVFDAWADTLKSKGIKCIKGNIYGDDNLFDDLNYGREWPWEIENFWYAAPSGALSFGENIVEIVIKPTAPNMPADVMTVPKNDYLNISNKIITSAEEKSEIIYDKDKLTELLHLGGRVNIKDENQKLFVPIGDPTNYFLTIFHETLERNGITVLGYSADLDTEEAEIISEELRTLFVHRSPQLDVIIKELNKSSNNFMAEQLIKTIGLELFDKGTVENGVKACSQILDVMGINFENIQIVDGSGISRLNHCTPKQIVNLLSYIYKSDSFASFYQSLPIAGVDGTMADRMRKSKAENNVRAKAGYLNGVRTLSGFLTTDDGEPMVFSMIVNNFLVPANLVDYIFDSVCIRLANFSRN